MPGQPHKIKRQVLQVSGCDAADAPRLQSELRDTYYRHLLPSIEKTCSELSTPGQVHRIALLEIDLGEVPLDTLETAMADRFEQVFERSLAAAIGPAESAELDSALELFSCFIHSGTVPWWADRSDRDLLDKALSTLIGRAPRALRQAIESAPDRERVWRRIALACSDRLLDQLLGVMIVRLTAIDRELGSQWLAIIETAATGDGHHSSVVRNLWWEELLRASGAEDVPVPEAPRFFRAVLVRLARRLTVEYGALVANLHRTLDHGGLPVRPWTREVVESLHLNAPGAAASVHDLASSAGEELGRLLAECERPGRFDDDTWLRVRSLIERLPADERARAVATIRSTPEGDARLREAEVSIQSRPRINSAPEGPESSDQNDPRPRVDQRFSDIDEVYVDNAGLVILWPFLDNFFSRLELVEAKQFRNTAARQRAAGLLQYLAMEEASVPEYLVPLNKVLCGMPLDEVFDFGPAITAEEIEACTDLLAATIRHAPILREMSIGGFRSSFLHRHGQLTVRDGHWLLRLERETHDIVLDRFPWNARIVALPWMTAVMSVEW